MLGFVGFDECHENAQAVKLICAFVSIGKGVNLSKRRLIIFFGLHEGL